MVILAPIDQLGWRSACSGVASPQLLQAPGAERAARSGEDDALDALGRRPGQRLQAGGVLAVDGQQLGAGIGDGGHEHVAGGDEALLVGQGDPPPLACRFEGRLEPGGADDGRHDAIGGLGRGRDDRRGAGGRLDAGAGERRPQLVE